MHFLRSRNVATGVMRDQGGASISDTHRPEPAWVPRLDGTAGGIALADPRQGAYAIPGGRLGVALEPGTMELSCVIASGVSEEMGALQSRMLEHPLQDVCMVQMGSVWERVRLISTQLLAPYRMF